MSAIRDWWTGRRVDRIVRLVKSGGRVPTPEWVLIRAVTEERAAEIQQSAVHAKVMVFGGLTYPLMAEYKKAADEWLTNRTEVRRFIVDDWMATR